MIVEEEFNYTGINASIYSVGLTIGNQLNNDEDIIIIKDNNLNILDVVHYYNTWGADNNGLSLCKINNFFQECTPTPGSLNGNFYDYSNLKINEFLPDPIGDDSASMPNGEWVELYNSGSYTIDLYGLILNDDYGNGIEISNTNTLSGNTTINPNSYLTIYRNGDGTLTLNNEDLEKVKLLYENTIIDEVSYSSSIEALSWSLVNNYWIKTIPTPAQPNNMEEPDGSSSLKIETIYIGSDDKAKFGDLLRVKINVYKGGTSKYNVELYVEEDNGEEVSKRTKLSAYDNFKNYTLTIPVQLFPNCNYNHPNGTYNLILTGLDEKDEEEFEIESITTSLCETIYKEPEASKIYIDFLEIPTQTKLGNASTVKIQITNNSTESQKIELWSYIYKGSNSISGDREENKQSITIPPSSSSIIILENSILEDPEPGNYKLKIKIKKPGRKTTDDFTSDIELLSQEQIYSSSIISLTNPSNQNGITSSVIYQSSDIKAKGYGIYFLTLVLVLLIIYLILSKKI